MTIELKNIQTVVNDVFSSPIRTASVGGSGVLAMDFGPRKPFPEELLCVDPHKVVVRKFQQVSTPFGVIPRVTILNADGLPVVRVPLHGWDPANPTYQATLAVFWLLHELGVEQVVVEASVGGLRCKPWDVVVPDDVFLSDTGIAAINPLAKAFGRDLWVRMSNPCCPRLSQTIEKHARMLKQDGTEETHHSFGEIYYGGTYYATPPGPFETRSKINAALAYCPDAKIIGQSFSQEAFAARFGKMCIAELCIVVNWAEGLNDGSWSGNTPMVEMYQQIATPVAVVMWRVIKEIAKQPRDCGCLAIAKDTDLSELTLI